MPERRTAALRRRLCWLGAVFGLLACRWQTASADATVPSVVVGEAGDRVVIEAEGDFSLRRAEGGAPLLGRWERTVGHAVFLPALPLPAGQSFALEWTGADGVKCRQEFRTAAASGAVPTVELRPAGVSLPANALKFYLHFSEPMERGVFLDRLRLFESDGREVVGPFRETELWSPDGRRLTVWFHPGRQKTGVNLNLDEGPVLREGTRCRLVVSGAWRSTAGVALGGDRSFEWEVGPADHTLPTLAGFRLEAPAAGSRMPLVVCSLEALDPGVLASALSVLWHGRGITGKAEAAPDGRSWRFVPEAGWRAGLHELRAAPNLEDLAGNSLSKPFEVDVQAGGAGNNPPDAHHKSLDFEIR